MSRLSDMQRNTRQSAQILKTKYIEVHEDGLWTSSIYLSASRRILNIQILNIQRVVFDELPAGFHVFAHERAEDGFAFRDVFQLY